MTLEEFRASTLEPTPPAGMSKALQALWYDAHGNWNKAHRIIQSASDSNSQWVHAYLHRKQGDLSNADYWYSRVSRDSPGASVDVEWNFITEQLLTAG